MIMLAMIGVAAIIMTAGAGICGAIWLMNDYVAVRAGVRRASETLADGRLWRLERKVEALEAKRKR